MQQLLSIVHRVLLLDMSKIVKCNQLLKASVTATFQASHSYPSILCNISKLAVLHAIELRVRFGRKDQSPVLYCTSRSLLQDTQIEPSTTIITYNPVQPPSQQIFVTLVYVGLK